MKTVLTFLLLLAAIGGNAQVGKGTVVVTHINAPSLQNSGGENPDRRVSVYLPPGYNGNSSRYPVIYYLHGFLWSDSLLLAADHFNEVLDKAIASGKIRPVIVVMPNENTLYGGSFYTNSTLTGNWADFVAKDLVPYIDRHFRTLANRESRGISGHSMGGHGALKAGMLFPSVFSSVYAFSPAMVGFANEFSGSNPSFKNLQDLESREALQKSNDFFAMAFVAISRAYSPNPLKPPFYTDFPYTYKGDSLLTNEAVLEKWRQQTPYFMADKYADSLRQLKALKFDWGRNDELSHIPVTCLQFSKKLEQLGIKHYAEEYIGTHGSVILTDDGRALNEMLPFFDANLRFEPTKHKNGRRQR